MKKERFSKDKLIKYLLWISIFTVAIIGLYVFQLFASTTLSKIAMALRFVVIPFVIAFFLSFIIGPFSNLFREKLKLPKVLSIIIAILIGVSFLLLILVGTTIFIVTQLSQILNSLISLIDNQTLETIINNIINVINEYLGGSGLNQIIDEILNQGFTIDKLFSMIGTILVALSGIASSILNILFIVVLTPVFMYYLIKEKAYIFTNISKVIPENVRHHAVELGKRSDIVIRDYLRGQGLMMLFVTVFFIITYGILSFFVPNFSLQIAILFGVMMGLFSILPYIGVWISMALPVILLVTLHLEHGHTNQINIYLIAIIVILLLNLVEQVLESSIVQPQIFGKQVHIHPLAVLSSFLFFGGVFGFIGFLLAIPIAGTIKVIFQYFNEINKGTNNSNESTELKNTNQ
ncbi:MAG: AI-2E family transporter [Tenericutes bacterium]|nr:AI-2E family transporter [Mycoplasmatota bacterium]